MSETSNWPLSSGALRTMVPAVTVRELDNHALCEDLYPIALGYYPNAHRHAMRRAKHDDYLLMYCVDGEGELVSEGQVRQVLPGSVVLLKKGTSHQYSANPENPWSLYWFHFEGSNAMRYCDYILPGGHQTIVAGLNDIGLQALFRSLMSTVNAGLGLSVFVHASSQVRAIFTYIQYLSQRRLSDESRDSMSNVTEFLRANLHKNLCLEELAEFRGLSKYHFNRQYKQLNGYAPMQHFTHMKIEQACLMLESSDMTVSGVGFALGYEDPLYFSRVFRKVMGVSPSGYRDRLK